LNNKGGKKERKKKTKTRSTGIKTRVDILLPVSVEMLTKIMHEVFLNTLILKI
jgi:hypothetical protein